MDLKRLGGVNLSDKAAITDSRVADPSKEAKPGDSITYVEISSIDTRDGFVTPDVIDAADAPSRARLKLSEGLVALSSVRPERSQVFVTSDDLRSAVGTTGLIMLQVSEPKALSPEILLATLKSAEVVDQLARRARASMYPTLAPDDVNDVVLPRLPAKVAKEVQAAMDSALKERSGFLEGVDKRTRLEGEVFDPLGPDKLLSDLQSGEPTLRKRSKLVTGDVLGRIDAEFHAKAYDSAIARMRKSTRVKKLGDLLAAADTGNSPAEDEYQLDDSVGSCAVLKVGALTGMGVQWSALEYAPAKYAEKENADVTDGDIIFNSTAHQPKYMAHKVDVVRSAPAHVKDRLTFVGELLRLRLAPSTGIPPEYVAAFLRSPLGREQIRRCIRGVSSHVYSDDVEEIMVPLPSKREAKAIADATRKVEETRWRYAELVRGAIETIDTHVGSALAKKSGK
jgi:hypothetical protein